MYQGQKKNSQKEEKLGTYVKSGDIFVQCVSKESLKKLNNMLITLQTS